MPQISRSALVPYSAEQMYQLVNDVHSYPDFLPGCTGSRVLNATSNEDDRGGGCLQSRDQQDLHHAQYAAG